MTAKITPQMFLIDSFVPLPAISRKDANCLRYIGTDLIIVAGKRLLFCPYIQS
jgi:hypothetical protein